MTREISYGEAVREALDHCLEDIPESILVGLGVPDPKGIFGTTTGLQEKYGSERVFDIPLSENAVTGVALGAAVTGMRPILVHQRMDFALVSIDQIVNQAAKWRYTFNGKMKVPLVIRMIVGRGWGQGPQHSQSFHSWFAHVPGLKVVLPTTPRDAKGMLIEAIEDDDPVIFIEHRWLHGVRDAVPEEPYRCKIGEAKILRRGEDVTLASLSYMSLEAMRAAELLEEFGISVEVLDLRSLRPLDKRCILDSVGKTGRLIVCDIGHTAFGATSEIVSLVTDEAWESLKTSPRRIGLPDCPTPTCKSLSDNYYPRAEHLAVAVMEMLGKSSEQIATNPPIGRNLDQPDSSFKGPF